MAEPHRPRPDGSASAGPLPVEEVEARAARLGVTIERVLEELGSIAFAKITRIVSWDTDKLVMTASGQLRETDKAAVAEIVASAKDQKVYRIKMFDKTPALALLLRWFSMLEKLKRGANEGEQVDDDGEDPREFLIRELARLRARRAGGGADPKPADAEGSGAPAPVGILAAT
jgi:Terminase small subunit